MAREALESGSPLLRRAVLALALCWLSLLGWMAATTGNPVVLNVRQFRQSDCVVSAEISAGQVSAILQLWSGDQPHGNIVLPAGQLFSDGKYILPLTRSGKQLVVTPLRSSEELRVIYPLTDDTRRQLETLLERQEQQGD